MSFVVDNSEEDENLSDNSIRIKIIEKNEPPNARSSLYVVNGAQLDHFLQQIYEYYVCGGMAKFALQRAINILKLVFIAALFYLITTCIEYGRLLEELQRNTTLQTDSATDAKNNSDTSVIMPLIHFSDYIVWGYLPWFCYPFAAVFSLYFISMLFSSAADVRQMFAVRDFYEYELKIKSLQSITWPQIAHSVSLSAELHRLGLSKGDSADVVGRIVRRNNYFVALMAQDSVLAAAPSQQTVLLRQKNTLMCLPLTKNAVRPIMTKTLQWALERTLFAFAFLTPNRLNDQLAALVEAPISIENAMPRASQNQQFYERNWLFEAEESLPTDDEQLENMQHSRLLSNQTAWFGLVGALGTRFRVLAILGLLLAPFVLCYLIVDFVLEHGERWQRQPQNIFAARQWSNDAQWRLMQYNEVPHLFQERLQAAAPLAHRYLNSFPLPKANMIAKFFSYCIGSLFLTLLFFGVVFDDDFFTRVSLCANRSALWWLTLLGAALALLRAFSNEEAHYEQDCSSSSSGPQQHFFDLQKYMQYCPAHWRDDRCTKKDTRAEFQFFYEHRWVGWLRELLGIVYTPYLLWFFFPAKSERLLRFLVQNSVAESDGTHACRFAVVQYPFDSPVQMRSYSSDIISTSTSSNEPGVGNNDVGQSMHAQKIRKSQTEFEKIYNLQVCMP